MHIDFIEDSPVTVFTCGQGSVVAGVIIVFARDYHACLGNTIGLNRNGLLDITN